MEIQIAEGDGGAQMVAEVSCAKRDTLSETCRIICTIPNIDIRKCIGSSSTSNTL
jgi:hypothetical protein